jgi:FkbM family methyltransferase
MTCMTLRFKIVRFFCIFLRGKYFRGNGILLKLAKLFIPPQSGVFPDKYGNIFFIDPVQHIDKAIYYEGCYEAGTLHVLSHVLREGDIFFDVGAEIGSISIPMSRVVGKNGRVFAFEPNSNSRDILISNMYSNSCENINIENCALLDRVANVYLFLNSEMNRGSDSLRFGNGKTATVCTRRLDEYSKNVIRAIKIDVEGSEYAVLKGGEKIFSSDLAPVVCVECDARDWRFLIKNILRSYGYRIFKLKHGKDYVSKLIEINSDAELPSHDNIFAFKTKHFYCPTVCGLFELPPIQL